MTTASDCPGTEGWQSLLELDLEPDQLSRWERHLQSCPACQDRLDQASADEEELRKRVRRVGDPTAAPSDPTLNDLLERLQEEKDLDPAFPTEPAELSYLRPSDRPELLGTLGVYEVREVIGQGGMGTVLKAYEPALQRLVAIKVLAPAWARSTSARRRFTREGQAAAAVCHEHIVHIYGVQESDGLPYLVMQYVAGESLQARLDRDGPLDLDTIVRIGQQTALGLAAAHAQGLIHRDIKPANILLEDDQEASAPGVLRIKVIDFGLARLVEDVGLTQDGVAAGTPEYMAPEQARGEPVDHRADLFSLGSVLYALCTGVPPFRAATPLAVLRQVSDTAPRAVRSLNPEVPVWLEALITRLLAKDPSDRYQSAADVAALLEARQSGSDSPERESKEESRLAGTGAARPSPKRLWLAALAALTTLGLGLIAFGAGGADGQPGELQEVLFHDFRHPLPPSFSFWGDPKGNFLKAEPEGMRITLPATYVHPFGGVGYLIKQGFQGDFEVTATVEVLHADPPDSAESGYGVGVILAVNKGDPAHGDWTSVGRQKRAQSGDVLNCYRSVNGTVEANEEPCTDRVGKLRLKRTGATLSYLWAPGLKGEAFRTIRQWEFGPEPIQSVRLTAVTGRQPCKVDVRLIDVQIRSGPASILAKGWLASRPFVALGFSLGLLLLLMPLGAWLYARQCRRARTMGPALAPSSGGLGHGEGGDQQSSPAALSPSLAAQCSACGQKLKARPDLAGKKVKCPQCGQAVLIPETNPGPLAPTASRSRFSILKKPGVIALSLVLAIVGGVCSWFFWPERDKYSALGNQIVPGVQESGFYHQEYDSFGNAVRWTNGKARLVIPIDRGKPPKGLVMKLQIYRPAQVKTAWVQIVANDRELTKQKIPLWTWEGSSAGKFSEAPLDLTGIDLGDELVLDINSDTFIPNRDQRALGVLVLGVELLHERPAPQ
jgi:serine/threonine protein kinase/DNA-directed RNA polymerase subunit RPC12/RpoP